MLSDAEQTAAAGIRSSAAHDTKHHPLDQAHSAVVTPTGALVYCICGFDGCAQRLEVDAPVWEAERVRRAAASAGVQVWHARGDRLVPVAPDVDGRVPGDPGSRPGAGVAPCHGCGQRRVLVAFGQCLACHVDSSKQGEMMRTCVWCREAIAPGERCWRLANGPLAHRVCALRQVLGSVEGDPEGMTRREAAEAAVQAWTRRSALRPD